MAFEEKKISQTKKLKRSYLRLIQLEAHLREYKQN